MAFTPCIHFDGTCAEAMQFYAAIFGATDLQMKRYAGEQGGADRPGPPDRIMQAQFTTDGSILMACDVAAGRGQPQQAMSVMIAPPSVSEAERLFLRLAEGGTVMVPLAATSWSAGYGMLKDRFGTHWIIGAPAAAH